MKKSLLLILILFAAHQMNAQSYNLCSDAVNSTSVTAGTYTVSAIDGTLPLSYCISDGSSTEYAEWIKYEPTSNYNVTVSSDLAINADGDTRLHIFKGTCTNLICITGDDDSGEYTGTNTSSYLSVANFNVEVGNTYYIVWDNKWSSNAFSWELTEAPYIIPPPIDFTLTSPAVGGTYNRGFVDINGDYLDDLVNIEQSAIKLKLQNTSGTFDAVTKVTTAANFLPSWSLSVGDYNADGYADLVYGATSGVTFMTSSYSGTGGYTDVSYVETSGTESVFSQRSNFVDINNDGHLDLFMCHDTAKSISYMNDGNNTLTFTNTNGLGSHVDGGNYASIWIDYDNDGDIDMFMAKCGGSVQRRTNQLYRNDGNGVYTEVGTFAGLDDPMQTWSAAWGDYDNDGDMDAYVGGSVNEFAVGGTHTPDPENFHKLMRNNGDGTFTNVIEQYIVENANYGIESIAVDFDNDGNLDVFTNGSILYGNGDLTFNLFSGPSAGAIGDGNNDGYMDVYNGSGNLYTNNASSGNNWIKIVTVGGASNGYSNINGIGARVEINTASGKQIRDVQSGTGFRYMSTLNTHFGIGTDTNINYIKITWPSGIIDQINSPNINNTLIVNEGGNTLSIEDTLSENLIMYPNPTQDLLNISAIDNLTNAVYTVFDITGRRITTGKLNNTTINVSQLSAGNYILRISAGATIKTQKFIKY
ncbi:FG-GAP-like repeat-containing protein [Lacinutrix undariae]